MIRISGLQYSYASSEFRLSIPKLHIERGERVAIVGPSGVGKSTLLMLLSGLIVPDEGRIEVADTPLFELSDAARRKFRATRIGFVFQDFELLEYLSVRENILLPFLLNRSLRLTKEVRAKTQTLAEQLGIAPKLGRKPGQLSHGERQRVAICRAMLTEPDVILADEPTGSLDPRCAREVLDLLFEQVVQQSTTLVFVTHDHALLNRFDRTLDLSSLQAASIANSSSEVS